MGALYGYLFSFPPFSGNQNMAFTALQTFSSQKTMSVQVSVVFVGKFSANNWFMIVFTTGVVTESGTQEFDL